MKAQTIQETQTFFFGHTKHEEGHLQNVFWADSQSRLDNAAFGGVVVFDSTYRARLSYGHPSPRLIPTVTVAG
jgi:hypothetical protein